jgi:FkbM family methyltransferase
MGLDVVRWPPHSSPRLQLIEETGVELVVDVGANAGQWAQELRAEGFPGRIVSIEPLPEAFQTLQAKAAEDPRWEVVNVAVGRDEGTTTMNVASNSMSSSILPLAKRHREAAVDVDITGQIKVSQTRLDSLDLKPDYLKIDVQGAELEVLAGALNTLRFAEVVEAELSVVPLYENQPLFQDVVSHLRTLGFVLWDLSPVFRDSNTGELLQFDGLFRRPSKTMSRRTAGET